MIQKSCEIECWFRGVFEYIRFPIKFSSYFVRCYCYYCTLFLLLLLLYIVLLLLLLICAHVVVFTETLSLLDFIREDSIATAIRGG